MWLVLACRDERSTCTWVLHILIGYFGTYNLNVRACTDCIDSTTEYHQEDSSSLESCTHHFLYIYNDRD